MNIKDAINQKILNIESLLSYQIQGQIVPGLEQTGPLEIKTPLFNLGNQLTLDEAKGYVQRIYQEELELVRLTNIYEKLFKVYYNAKEYDIETIKGHLKEYQTYSRYLDTSLNGIRTARMLLSDPMWSTALFKNKIEDGITLPILSSTKIQPKSLQVKIDSAIRLGSKEDETLQASPSSLVNNNKEDIFTVYNIEGKDFSFLLDCKFSSTFVFNCLQTWKINKIGQTVNLQVTNGKTSKLLYSGPLSNKIIFTPEITNNIVLRFEVKGPATFDLFEIEFLSNRYKDTLDLTSAKIPNLNGRLLSFEGILTREQSDTNIFKTEVNILGQILKSFSSEEKLAGPFTDPVIQAKITYQDKGKLRNELQESQLKRTKEFNNADTAVCISNVVFSTAKPKEEIATRENQTTWKPIPILVPGLENFFEVKINNKAILSNQVTLDPENPNTISYTENGYVIETNPLSIGSRLEYNLPVLPSSFEDKTNTLFIPDLATGSNVMFKVATEIKTKKIPVNLAVQKTYQLPQYSQSLKFLNGNTVVNLSTDQTLYPLEVVTGKWSMDFKNGILKFGSALNTITHIEVTYLAMQSVNRTNTSLTGNLYLQESQNKIFSNRHLCHNTLYSNSDFYSIDKNKTIYLSGGSQKISYPKTITLVKEGVSIPSFKEVSFIDGQREFLTSLRKRERYQYKSYISNVVKLEAQGSFFSGIDFTNVLVITPSNLLSKKATLAELSSIGDYYITTTELYVKTNNPEQFDTVLIEVNATETNKLFSIDYNSNTLYLSASAEGIEVETKYSLVEFCEYELGFNTEYKPTLKESEFFITQNQSVDLVEYFTPEFAAIEIGLI